MTRTRAKLAVVVREQRRHAKVALPAAILFSCLPRILRKVAEWHALARCQIGEGAYLGYCEDLLSFRGLGITLVTLTLLDVDLYGDKN